LVDVMGCTFDVSRKVIKNFVSKIKQTFWKVVMFAVGACKSERNLVHLNNVEVTDVLSRNRIPTDTKCRDVMR